MDKLYIIDAVNLLFRSYFAITPMTNANGESTNALFGFIRSLNKIIKDFSPTHLVAVFDGPENKKSRSEIYGEYKAHRTKMPGDLFPQLEKAVAYCEIASIPMLMVPGVEADDTMGSVAKWAEENGSKVYLCSSDKDLCQMVTDHIYVINPHKDNLVMDSEKVKETFGVTPSQIIDYLAIVGDASDNIPGIEGFGPKTATDLLSKYGTLDRLLEHAHELTGKKREMLIRDRETALLSRRLATINLNVDFPHDTSFFQLKTPEQAPLRTFYHEMDFLTLLREMGRPPEEDQKFDYILIQSKQELQDLIHHLQKQEIVCFSIAMGMQIEGISFSVKSHQAWHVSLRDQEERIQLLKPFLESKSTLFCGHHTKQEMHALLGVGIELKQVGFDTLIASQLLAPHVQKNSLDDLILMQFGKRKFHLDVGKGKKYRSLQEVPLEEFFHFSSENADFVFRLYCHLKQEIEKQKLSSILYEIEIPLIPILFKMEMNGIYIDQTYLKLLSEELAEKIEKIETTIFTLAGQKFNINSPKQLASILFESMGIKPVKKTATGYSTAADVLDSLKETHPIIEHVLAYRALEKLRSTYVDALPLQVTPPKNRIHCTFNQIGAATGRLSCQDPNLQNIPIKTEEGRKIRKAFKPARSDWSYLAADYSQIELRLLAHLSEDSSLIKAFQAGEDIHSFTASLVFNVPLQNVTSDMRRKAKAVNFGIIYGQQAFGLSQGLTIDYQEASEFIQTYFERYQNVKEFFESCKEKVRLTGKATTLSGRLRPIPEINSPNPLLRSAAERLAMNTPLQGTAADLIKIAMQRVEHLLQEEPHLGFLVLQIHDELLFEVPDESIETLSTHVKKIMENVIPLKVPLVVDISIGKNWGEC